MTIEPLGPYQWRRPGSPATSREINEAIELLKENGCDPAATRLLEIWNAHRLVNASLTVATNEELRNLFAGLRPTRNGDHARAALGKTTDAEGAWS